MARHGQYNADPAAYHLASEYVTARKEGAVSLSLDEYVALVRKIGTVAISLDRTRTLDEDLDTVFGEMQFGS